MLTRRLLLTALTLLGAAAPAAAQVSPPRGSRLRAELMDALRPRVQVEIGGQIEFVVRTLRVMEPWAFAHVVPQRPGGGKIDWNRTKFREDMRDGNMSDGTMALLRRSPNTAWDVVELAIGPSDLPWDSWREERNLPRELFTDE
jgi:hypothetical protein